VTAGFLRRLGPGIAIAATGVGAGDLAAASACGFRFGTALAWSVVVGAALKYVLNEGIARWQLGQGQSVLRAIVERLPRPVSWYLLLYLLLWTPAVAGALAAACGIALNAIWPALGVAAWGSVQAAVAAALVLAGGYRLFEAVMEGLMALMFIAIVGSAIWLRPDPAAVLSGLVVPHVPDGSAWVVLSMLGGLGGSVTLLAYGYWIEEKGWRGRAWLPTVRLDLGVAYALTGTFGVAMVVLAAALGETAGEIGGGVSFLVALADVVGGVLGGAGRGIFLLGVWGAVFTSMLGVWQGVPYLHADFVGALRGEAGTGSRSRYRAAVVAIAVAAIILVNLGRPLWLLLGYTVVGALFLPFLALCLLRLNAPGGPQGASLGNRLVSRLLLWAALAVFLLLGLKEAGDALFPAAGGT